MFLVPLTLCLCDVCMRCPIDTVSGLLALLEEDNVKLQVGRTHLENGLRPLRGGIGHNNGVAEGRRLLGT